MNGRIIPLTLYAMVSAFEKDLRAYVTAHYSSEVTADAWFGPDTYQKCLVRANNDGVTFDGNGVEELIEYLDFDDVIQVVFRNKAAFPEDEILQLRENSTHLHKVSRIRNRVMHSRSPDVDDYSFCMGLFDELTAKLQRVFSALTKTLRDCRKNPSWVLSIALPQVASRSAIFHNLPLADTMDTGFIGRKKELGMLNRWFSGPYPVATIIGEGGIGKSALGLEFAYSVLDLVDAGDLRLDGIIWVSSKTNRLTIKEIERINDALDDSDLVFRKISTHFGGESSNPIEDVIDAMDAFRFLLIIDNLETIIDDNIRYFLENLKGTSKVLITSRIGVGSMNYPVRITPMERRESISLIRSYAKALDVSILFKESETLLAEYAKRMEYNPGFIKWFVSVVKSGVEPSNVLNNNKNIFLNFCMENVYKHLGSDERKVLKCLSSLDNGFALGELSFLTKLKIDRLMISIQKLMETSFLIQEPVKRGDFSEAIYSINPLCRQYLMGHQSYTKEDYQSFVNRFNEMARIADAEIRVSAKNKYDIKSITRRSDRDLMIVSLLTQALSLSKRGEYRMALARLAEAKDTSGDFFEIYRISAFINANHGHMSLAKQDYETAMELMPTSSPVLVMYAGFISRYENNYSKSIDLLKRALKIDPDSSYVKLELARAFLRDRNYADADRVSLEISIGETDMPGLVQLFDLKTRIAGSWAFSYVNNKDYVRALEKLEALCAVIDEIPNGYMDDRLNRTIARAHSLSESLCRSVMHFMASEEGIRSRALEVNHKISAVLGDGMRQLNPHASETIHGVIKSVNTRFSLGTISDENGSDVFFYFHDCAFQVNESSVDCEVEFELGENHKGPLARNVVMLDIAED